jgi:hypothetical protein
MTSSETCFLSYSMFIYESTLIRSDAGQELGVWGNISNSLGHWQADRGQVAKNLWSAMWKGMDTGAQSSGLILWDYGRRTVNRILPNPMTDL